jgi:thiol:disulfide interchange protein DsbC
MFNHSLVALLLMLVIMNPAMAEAQDATDALRARLSALVPGLQPDSIKPSPVEGIYEVRYGAQVLYLSADGRYMFRGSLFDLEQRQDLTEAASNQARMEILEKLDEQQMIVFSPKRPKHTVTVFTDIDCPYCRKLHAEIDQYLQEGIEVRYLAFPRAGVGSPSFEKAVDVWCADDPNAALTHAKRGEPVSDKTCDNPIKEQMELGQMLGVSGTPAIVLENGEMIPGYQSAKALSAMLDTLADTGKPLSKR